MRAVRRASCDGLIGHAFFKDGNAVRIAAALIDGVPAFADTLGVFDHIRMLQDAARLCAVLIEGRAVFITGQPHADGLLCHGNRAVTDKAVKAKAGNMKNVLR